ncbi:MAG TPA: ParB/RepB/Spo0J family partition protein [Acidimicrobiia bacterium]|jgi:ParB family chromosome partitioning protein|nr:ParB/RepB/Spo0J family partition protein [Acidimicrobiia bacterium]
MARPGGLGKGLGALIPTGAAERVGGPAVEPGLQELPIAAIRPNPYQPRDRFDEEGLGALADSIREVGLLQPVLVRPAGDGYELVAGERRWRAARRAGLQVIPAIVRQTEDHKALQAALVENLQRDDLNPLEEAAAYQQMIEDFSMTHDQVAATVGKSRAAVSNTLRLLLLPPSIQRALRDDRLSMGHARALLGTPDRAFQESLARRAIKDDLSVRAVEDAVRARNEGTDDGERARSTTARIRPPGLLEIEELLAEHLQTRVRIRLRAGKKGTLAVDFGGLDDLERIYRRMTGDRGAPSAASA